MTTPESTPKFRLEFVILLIAAFLLPLMGGHVAIDARPIDDGFLGELIGGDALPYMVRFILGTLILGGLALVTFKQRVVQLPNIKIVILLTLLVVFLALSITFGAFPYPAFMEWLTWLVYGGALFLTVATVGRSKGPEQLALALLAGISIAALLGINEYIGMMRQEPSYRIFAGWMNPNAAASIFVVGTLLACGLASRLKSISQFLGGLGGALCLLALILTQSKGGYLACGVGLAIFAVTAFTGRTSLKSLAASFIPIPLAILLAFALTQAAKTPTGASEAFSRITATGSTAEQSVGFRQNLWQTAIQLGQKHPMGTGPGNFRFYSTEPGIIESTVNAHNSYLQLLADGGYPAFLLFIGLAIVWLTYAFRGLRQQPAEHTAFRAAVIGATIGLAAHGMVESNLSFLGSGLLFFILVGLSLQLSTDGTSPEAIPQPVRSVTVLIACILPIVGLAISAAGETQKAAFLSKVAAGQVAELSSSGESLKNLYGDPEALYLASIYAAKSPEERLDGLQRAANQLPQNRALRATARSLADLGRLDEAIAVNDRVFRLDPNNLRAHFLKIELHQKKGDSDAVAEAARATIAVESSRSYQTRAIPELIPTETFQARLILAEFTTNHSEKIKLLEEALAGFSRYFTTTAPIVKRMTDGGLPDYGGESKETVLEKQALARSAVESLRELYRQSGVSDSEIGDKLKPISEALAFEF
jgi:O-antigen ligase